MPQQLPSRFIRLDLQVWIMAGTFTLAAIFLAAHGYRHARDAATTDARFATELTSALAAHANLGFAEIDRDLQLAARDLAGPDGVLQGDTASRHRLLAAIAAASSSIQTLLLHDTTGRSVAESAWPEPRPLLAADRDYFTVHATAGAADAGLVIAPPVRSRLSGLMSLAVSRAVRDPGGRLLGVVVAHIAPSYFDALAVRFGTLPGHMIALVGDDGIVRYASDPAWLGQVQAALPGWTREAGLATRQSNVPFDGAERVYRPRRLDAYPLTLVTGTAVTGTAVLLRRTAADVGPGLAALLLLMAGGGAAFLLYKRRAERSLAAADAERAKLQAVAQMVPGLVYQWRHDGSGAGRFVWVSPRSRDLLGIDAERFLPKQGGFRLHPEDFPRWRDSLDESTAAMSDWSFEGRFTMPDGSIRFLRSVARPVRGADGTVIYNGVVLDLTEERRRVSAVITAETRLSMLLDAAKDGIISLDHNLRITHFNRGAETLFGVSAAEMMGHPLDRLIPPESRAIHEMLLRRMLNGPDGSRDMGNWRGIRGLRADGTLFPLLASVSKTTAPDGPMLCAIMRDMTEVATSEQQLTDLTLEQKRLLVLAEQADRAKAKFLATMSHELRTPLNAIIGFSEAMLGGISGPIAPPRYAGYVGDIQRSGQHLLELINDILDLSKIQQFGTDFRFVALDLREVIDDALVFVSRKAEAKEIAIAIEAAAEAAAVVADTRALRQVMINLLANAVKYTPPGGRITIAIRPARQPGWSEIRVDDTGPGVAPDLLPQIGNPFVQERDVYKGDNPGSGLGLAIVRELVSAHHGEVRFANRPEGGFRATVELPATPPLPPQAAALRVVA